LVEAKNVAVFHLQTIEIAREENDIEEKNASEKPFRVHKYRH